MESEVLGHFAGGVSIEAHFKHFSLDFGQRVAQPLQFVVVIGDLVGAGVVVGDGTQQVRNVEGITVRATAVMELASVGPPFASHFAAYDDAGQRDQLFGTGDGKFLVPEPDQQAFVDRLQEVHAVQVAAELGAEENAGHDPDLAFIALANKFLSRSVPGGRAAQQFCKITRCDRIVTFQDEIPNRCNTSTPPWHEIY